MAWHYVTLHLSLSFMGITHPAGTSSRSDGRVDYGPASRNGPAIQNINAHYEKWKNKYTVVFLLRIKDIDLQKERNKPYY
jgi:hypothetical protein